MPPPQALSSDDVVMKVPADPDFVGLVRLTAAGMATRMPFTVDEVDDVRIAVDELCYLLLGPDGRPGVLTVRLRHCPEERVFSVDARLAEGTAAPRGCSPMDGLAREILRAVCHTFDVDGNGGCVTFQTDGSRGRP